MPGKPDYWKALGLKPGATLAEIRSAYHRYAFHFHPDRNSQQGDLFLEVQRAYQELVKLKEAEANRVREAERPRASKPITKPARKAHHDLSFVTSHIRKRSIYIGRMQKVISPRYMCKNCRGYGVVPDRYNRPIDCPLCEGSGASNR